MAAPHEAPRRHRPARHPLAAMNLDRFEQAAQEAFGFLERDFNMVVHLDTPDERKRHSWVRYVTYCNDTTFVRTELDNKDRAFNLLTGPLVDGQIPPYPIFLEREEEPVLWLPVWAILEASGVEHPPFSFAEDQRLDQELAAWATALREHASAALRGEFEDLAGAVRQVKEQRAEHNDRL